MNQLVKGDDYAPPALVPANMSEAMQLAQMMAQAKFVPKDLHGSPADCLMVIQQALRWQMDVFAVAQECSVIQGKLMHSGKLTAAVVNSRAGLVGRLTYEYRGEGENRSVIVSGQLRGESEPRVIEVALRGARTNNQIWQKQPDQQLAYHGARVWARRHVPELMLGVYSPEEFDEAPAPARRPATPAANPMLPAPTPHDPETGEVEEFSIEQQEDQSRQRFIAETREHIRAATDWQALGKWWNGDEQKKARRDFDLATEEVDDLKQFVAAKIAALKETQS